MHGTSPVWTNERNIDLALMWNDGLVTSAIAKRLPFIASNSDGGLKALKRHLHFLRKKSECDAECDFWSRFHSPWTPEVNGTLAYLWQTGLSCSKIAKLLPELVMYPDGGLNALKRRLDTLRSTSQNNAELLFWTRGKKQRTEIKKHMKVVRRCENAGIRENSLWTRDRTAALALMWHRCMSASEIAKELDCFLGYKDGGRSAVIGRIDRMRDYAENEQELAFWTHSTTRTVAQNTSSKRTRTSPCSADTKKGHQCDTAYTRSKRERSVALTLEARRALIESVIVPAVKITAAESDAEYKRALFAEIDRQNRELIPL